MKARLSVFAALVLYGPALLANDFPTQARVEYVLACMAANGGQSYDTLYACVCAVDRIAEQIPYREYEQSQVLTYLRRTPGERGGVFRDAAPNSRSRVARLAQIGGEAERSCSVRAVRQQK